MNYIPSEKQGLADDPYLRFLQEKVQIAPESGFDCDESEVNPILKPHQRAIVVWAVRGGRRAIFAAFGLGKSVIQLEILRIILLKLRLQYPADPNHYGLIVAPLGVRQEFIRDAAMLGIKLRFIRRTEELMVHIHDGTDDCLFITNYESVRDGKLNPLLFAVVSLDEASVLRSFGSKTYQTFLTIFDGVPYRFVATATPSPNKFKELIHYAGYLGIMDTGQALTRFFQRDSKKANNLTLYPHMEAQFWLWLSSWAIFLQTPSDLGYSDEGYVLPPMTVHYHEIPSVLIDDKGEWTAGKDRDGQIRLMNDSSLSLPEAAREKRTSLHHRIGKMQEILAESPDDRFLLWHNLEAERHAIEEVLPEVRYGHWDEYKDGNAAALALYERHYSAHQYADGRVRNLFVGPGKKTVLMTRNFDALFVWKEFIDDSGQKGINCGVFRNEGTILSSELIREAMAIAWLRWPGQRLYTYVNGDKVRSTNPGCCFKKAGWTDAGMSKGGLHILEALPGVPVPDVSPKAVRQSVWGTQDLDQREEAIIGFSEGQFQYLSTKPEIAGSGCNFQRHCHKAIFLGINYGFNDFIQAVHRIQRFLQDKPVEIHLIHTEAEREVLRALLTKWEQHKEMVAKMTELIREHGLTTSAMKDILFRSIGVERIEVKGRAFTVANNDCVIEARRQETDSVDEIVTSIPFAYHYEYTPSMNDFGFTETNEHFWQQMDFLTPELLRMLKPGRLACIHVKDRILFGNTTGTGIPTVSPFHCEAIQHGIKHGFDYLGMITVVTDVVRENNQTYRLGWTENGKDGTKMGVGSPEYIILLRKPQSNRGKGYADVPVAKSKGDYSRARWQVDAHAFWRSSGDRCLTAEEMAGYGPGKLASLFTQMTLERVYDYEFHVRIGEELEAKGALPATFMAIAPGSHYSEVWHDVNRMLTLNGAQSQKNLAMHVCPLQFDIVDRLIRRYSNPGELVYDPFAGLMTVPLRALKLGRRGAGSELNTGYFMDGVHYLKAMEEELAMPSLFDFEEGVEMGGLK